MTLVAFSTWRYATTFTNVTSGLVMAIASLAVVCDVDGGGGEDGAVVVSSPGFAVV